MAASIEIDILVKSYGPLRAVDGLSFHVDAGQIVGLLGPNGAGKTSTLECLLGLRAPDSGVIRMNGVDAAVGAAAVRRKVGTVLQSTALQDKITPREAISLFASFYGLRRNSNQWLERFGLADKADAKFDTLSGGQKQRLALALAFVHEPAVLVLDEPTAGLDPETRRSLHDAIRAIAASGCAVLLSTHMIDEAQSLCDRVVIIHHGKAIANGSPRQLIAGAPARLFVETQPAISEYDWEIPAAVTGNFSTFETRNVTATVVDVVTRVRFLGVDLLDLRIEQPSLEDVFLKLTGSTFEPAP